MHYFGAHSGTLKAGAGAIPKPADDGVVFACRMVTVTTVHNVITCILYFCYSCASVYRNMCDAASTDATSYVFPDCSLTQASSSFQVYNMKSTCFSIEGGLVCGQKCVHICLFPATEDMT